MCLICDRIEMIKKEKILILSESLKQAMPLSAITSISRDLHCSCARPTKLNFFGSTGISR